MAYILLPIFQFGSNIKEYTLNAAKEITIAVAQSGNFQNDSGIMTAKSEDDVIAEIAQYVSNPNQMKIEEIFAYLQVSSKRYINDLLYDILLATVVEPD